jgi:hypothetical protein
MGIGQTLTEQTLGSLKGGGMGSTLGGLVGSFFGPEGSAVGAIAGGAADKLASMKDAPAGPGATIAGGTVDTSGSGATALTVAQSLQKIAIHGLQNQAAPDGHRKRF